MKPAFSVLCAGLIGAGTVVLPLSGRTAPADDRVQYNRDVRPILSENCFVCHGPDSSSRKADLRLDRRDDAIKAGAFVPGKPDESEAIRRIFATSADEVMPLPASKKTLTQEQKEILRRWVAQGAEYQPHWSLVPLPDHVSLPQTKTPGWCRSEIDHFVLARLKAEGGSPSAEAPRPRWLRRVSFDLTGLPPTQAELDAFLADRSADAFARQVDRLLASPRFGEKMAVHWLDVARYADSFGYQADLDSHAWPYREWVVQAINDNLPWNQFITWQLAGDLLPNPTRAQRLATAFCRVHRKTQEGGSVEEEFRQDGISDRVHTFGTAFLGMTMECARCHDHKYDPITMRDYYSLGAFFNSIDEWGLLHGRDTIQPHPVLYLATPEQEAALKKHLAAIAEAEQAVEKLRAAREPAFRQWLAGRATMIAEPLADLVGAYDLDGAAAGKLLNAADSKKPGTFSAANRFVPGKFGQAVQFTGDDAISLDDAGVKHMHDPVSVAFWLRPGEDYPRAVVFHNSDGWDPGYNGYELLLEHGRLRWMVAREWPGNCIAVRTRAQLAVGQWTHVAVSYDGSSRAAGLRVYLGGRLAEVDFVRDKLVKDSASGTSLDFGERRRDNGLRNGAVDEIRVFTRAITPLEVAQVFDGKTLTGLLAKRQPAPSEIAALREYYDSAIDGEVRAAASKLRAARVAYRETMDQVREIPVMEEMPQARPAFLLTRGAYDAPSAKPVPRDTPAALPRFPSDQPRNRLGLARWLTDHHHPLTSRVVVNRLWQEFFGRGLVATSENFGVQGQTPSHPELLDWLARDFIDHGWDLKRFCRRIVLSATYRQDSKTAAELRSRDPDNVLLSRGPAKRLSAEMLRDNALALGGLLRPELGGPPVKPYEPEGSMWRSLNNFLPEYQRDTGAALYRRSLYTFWRRTTPPPNMMTFDSAAKEVCTARRQLTLTPLQPLVLLNDPQFVEAARAFGERMLRYGGATVESRLVWAFREATGRAPTAAETVILRELYDAQLASFQHDKASALKLLKTGEHKPNEAFPPYVLAAAATAAGALLNLDATSVLR
jgi:mono/diheme cytochrome c family protein